MIRQATSVISLVLVLANVCAAGDLKLVDRGKPKACVVVLKDAHAAEKEAAADLVWAVNKATGVQLPYVTFDGKSPLPPEVRRLKPVFVSMEFAKKEAARKFKELPPDGAIVHVTSRGAVIGGPTPGGTANGVATVLMEDIGVRTYYPEPEFSVVPEAETVTLREREARPTFGYRIWSGCIGRDAAAYRRRNRLTDTRVPAARFGFGHNLGRVIPVEKYGKEHPEYFPLIKGKRYLEGTGVAHGPQPCFTNPDVVRLTIEAAREFFDKNPQRDTFSLCVNDNWHYCECDNCGAMDQPYRNIPVGRQYSESYYDYVSKVAEAVAKSHPGRYVGVYAYWNVEQTPRNRESLPDNVAVALTLDILQHHDANYRKKDRELVGAWRKYAKSLSTYVYYGLGWYTPRCSPRLVAEELKFFAETGIYGVYCESYPLWAWAGPMLYVASRVQWGANADVGRILDEFHRDLFGEVADEMRAYHDACERYWLRERKGYWFEGLDRLGPEFAMGDLSILAEAKQHLDAAAAGAKDPLVKKRIAWIQKGFDFVWPIGEAFEATWRMKKDWSGPEALRRLVKAGLAAEEAHKALQSEPGYVHAYYQKGERFDRKCWGWFKGPVLTNAEKLWKDFQKDHGERAEEKWSEFDSSSGFSGFLKLRGWEFKR